MQRPWGEREHVASEEVTGDRRKGEHNRSRGWQGMQVSHYAGLGDQSEDSRFYPRRIGNFMGI